MRSYSFARLTNHLFFTDNEFLKKSIYTLIDRRHKISFSNLTEKGKKLMFHYFQPKRSLYFCDANRLSSALQLEIAQALVMFRWLTDERPCSPSSEDEVTRDWVVIFDGGGLIILFPPTDPTVNIRNSRGAFPNLESKYSWVLSVPSCS